MATKIKKGDEVVVTAGDHKGSKGKILQVLREKNRVIVEGVNMIKKHEKKSQDNPKARSLKEKRQYIFQMFESPKVHPINGSFIENFNY